MQPAERQEQQLQADQGEQQGVEDFVDQLPELVHIAAGLVRHGVGAPVVADDQPGHHHGDRRRHVQARGQRGAADDQGEGEHDRHLVLVDAAHHHEDPVAQRRAEQHAADRFVDEHPGDGAEGRRRAELEDAYKDGEYHHRGAVIEQRFADDGGGQRLGRAGRLEDAEHGDRVGGRDQRAEQQAVDEAHVPAEQGEGVIGEEADHRGGDQHAEGGEQADRPLVVAQVVEVDVQRTGEQQRGEEPGHEDFGEVDAADDLLHLQLQHRIAEQRQALGDQREEQGGGHHADGRRQADETVVHIGEQGGQGDERRCEIEHDVDSCIER
ncbi:hypothetical protein D3C81_1276590 [compost metagenome]